MKSEVIFSVVIPTRNRDASLRNLLSRINDQTLTPSEIIIVDSSEKKQSEYESINNPLNKRKGHHVTIGNVTDFMS